MNTFAMVLDMLHVAQIADLVCAAALDTRQIQL
jgi:hypothetical protein